MIEILYKVSTDGKDKTTKPEHVQNQTAGKHSEEEQHGRISQYRRGEGQCSVRHLTYSHMWSENVPTDIEINSEQVLQQNSSYTDTVKKNKYNIQ